jgi:hypothetical protein
MCPYVFWTLVASGKAGSVMEEIMFNFFESGYFKYGRVKHVFTMYIQ